MKTKNKSINESKLPTNSISRSLSLFGLTASGTARFAKHKLQAVFSSKDRKDERYRTFLRDQAVSIVKELGHLKGSVMKAGQMLSTYGEHFLPEDVNKILKTLQADAAPVAWPLMRKTIYHQLGRAKYDKLDINPNPIAAASMGQVYLAKFKDDPKKKIALKVQYPGVEQAIDSDLKALRRILSASSILSVDRNFDAIFEEIRTMLHHEVDYGREAAFFQEYAKLLEGDKRYIVPQIYGDFSTKRLLAMSYEDGELVDSDNVKALSLCRRNKLGSALMDLMFREMFEWRMVQTDPHLGNYRIRMDRSGDDAIVLFDFGAVRKFPKRYIEPFADLVRSSLQCDHVGICKAAQNLGFLRNDDTAETRSLFVKICCTAIEPFSPEWESPTLDGSDPGSNPYFWGDQDLADQLVELAKDAIFAFKFRAPPREAVFLDRKMVGTYTFLVNLGFALGPRKLILKYLN